MPTIINTTQKTQKYLELKDTPNVNVYVQFGKAKKNKRRPFVVVNKLNGLRNTRDKIKQGELLRMNGIKKPQTMDCDTAYDHVYNGGTVVAKKKYHSRGNGMHMIDQDNIEDYDLEDMELCGYYFEEFVNANREWRIHVSRYQEEDVVSYRKCFYGSVVEDCRERGVDLPKFRNIENSFYKKDIEEDKSPIFKDMVKECIKALEVLDMDIAGCDVGENTRTGEFWIYEVNSACGMWENTRKHYERAINHIIDWKLRRLDT